MKIKRSLLEELRDKDASQEKLILDLEGKLTKAKAERAHLSTAIENLQKLEKPKE